MDDKSLAVSVSILVGLIGYLFSTFCMKPILQFLEIKAKILSDLVFYAQVVNADGLNEQMQKLHEDRNLANRRHSAEITACILEIPSWCQKIFLRNYDLILAAQLLIGLSNTTNYEDAAKLEGKIKTALAIKSEII
jgi:hypothetical protein